MTPDLRIVDATPELLDRFYDGKPPPFTLRACVAMKGEQVLGVGGIHYVGGMAVAFSDHKPELGRKDRARCFRFLEQRLAQWRGKLIAVCYADHSKKLLQRLGFEETDTPNTMVRAWRP